MDLKMKTILGLLAGLACAALQAQPDIGTYPSTTWASTNLLVNRALETGQVGQAIGYTSNGVVGPITTSGGGSIDLNNITGAYPTTNEFVAGAGNELALIGAANDTRGLWSKYGTTLITMNTLGWAPAPGATGGSEGSEFSGASLNITSAGSRYGLIQTTPFPTVPGQRYRLSSGRFQSGVAGGVSTNDSAAAPAPAPTWNDVRWLSATNTVSGVITNWMVEFTATTTSDIQLWAHALTNTAFAYWDNDWNGPYTGLRVESPGATKVGDVHLDPPSDGTMYGMRDGTWTALDSVQSIGLTIIKPHEVLAGGTQWLPLIRFTSDRYGSDGIVFAGGRAAYSPAGPAQFNIQTRTSPSSAGTSIYSGGQSAGDEYSFGSQLNDAVASNAYVYMEMRTNVMDYLYVQLFFRQNSPQP